MAKIDSLVSSTRLIEDSDRVKLEMGARASFFDLLKVNDSLKFVSGDKLVCFSVFVALKRSSCLIYQ